MEVPYGEPWNLELSPATELSYAIHVSHRRENLRQRFALTRLRNFYRDVRTTNNNTTWPPERDASPTTRRSGAGALGAGGAAAEDPEEGGVHVAFYDSERAIKTPRPVVSGTVGCVGGDGPLAAAAAPAAPGRVYGAAVAM